MVKQIDTSKTKMLDITILFEKVSLNKELTDYFDIVLNSAPENNVNASKSNDESLNKAI